MVPGPREGWLSLLLLTLVVLSPALSLADSAWVDDLEIVPWLAFFSVLLGAVLAKLRVRWLVAHLFAAEIGLALVGTYFASMAPRGDWEGRILWLWGRVSAWLEAAFGGGMSNDSMLFALLMALAAWLIGYLSAWFAFRVHNVWPPLVACGSGLLVNLSYRDPGGLAHFLVFLLSALLLLTRITLFQKERDWDRSDAEYNRRLKWSSLWGSVVLSAGIVALAWSMPVGAVNASVAENWYNVTGPWHGLQVEFDRLFASVGSSTSKVEGNRFAKTLALKGAIELGPDPVMLVSSPMPEYWAAQAYDRYTGQGWMSSADQTARLDTNDARLASTSLYRGRRDIEQRFKLLTGRTASVFAATAPVKLTMPVYSDHFGTLDELAALRSTVVMRQGYQYGVVSSVSVASAEQLRKAGTNYPEWTRRYLELPSNPRLRNSPLARVAALARRVIRDADTPYDAAVALEQHLRTYRYEIKVASPPPERDAVDWFLFTSKEGYCDYYASAMAVMARLVGIPSRVVSGYNTGRYNEETGLYEVRQENAHSWPELFFPEYGWVRFEPTPSLPVPERPEVGPADASPEGEMSQADLEALSLDLTDRDNMLLEDDFDFMYGLSTIDADSPEVGPMERSLAVVPAALLAGLLVAWAFWQRAVAGVSSTGRLYLQICWIAGFLGWRPRPSCTPTEYGRLLGAASPESRPDLEIVVSSYVEETYGGRPASDREEAERSWRRLRWKLPVRLLRKAVVRGDSWATRSSSRSGDDGSVARIVWPR